MPNFPTDMYDRLELEDGKIVRIVKAVYDRNKKYSEIDIYKEDEDGNSWERNLYHSCWGGYCVAFPGLPRNVSVNSWYYDPSIADTEEWTLRDKRSSIGWSKTKITTEERGLVIMYHYDFKYVFKKYDFKNLREMMDKLIVWKQHPEIELMLAAGFEKLAMCKSLYRLKAENKKAVLKFCRNNPDACNLTFREIRACMKIENPDVMIRYFQTVPAYNRLGWTRETYKYYGLIAYEDFKYLDRKGLASTEGVNLYSDYLRMLNNSNHDSNSEYWKYPANLRKQHDKLVEEERIERETRQRMEEERKKRETEKRDSDFQKVCKKYAKYNRVVDDYNIYISNNFDDWKKQADALHQCIVYADYMSKVAHRECLIFFIRKNDEPIATAEILPGKKLGQFYGNEIDRNNCKPSEEVTAIFNKWFETIKVKEAI